MSQKFLFKRAPRLAKSEYIIIPVLVLAIILIGFGVTPRHTVEAAQATSTVVK